MKDLKELNVLFCQEWGLLIMDVRKRKGLSITELARDAGITAMHLTHIEKGDRTCSPLIMYLISTALDESHSKLMNQAYENIQK